jgi:TolB-like protein
LIDKKTVETYAPQVYTFPYEYHSWPGFYGYVVTGGQITQQEEVVHLETNLYDAKTAQLIWMARSDTWLGDVQQTLVRAFAKAIIDKMVSDKIIR